MFTVKDDVCEVSDDNFYFLHNDIKRPHTRGQCPNRQEAHGLEQRYIKRRTSLALPFAEALFGVHLLFDRGTLYPCPLAPYFVRAEGMFDLRVKLARHEPRHAGLQGDSSRRLVAKHPNAELLRQA